MKLRYPFYNKCLFLIGLVLIFFFLLPKEGLVLIVMYALLVNILKFIRWGSENDI